MIKHHSPIPKDHPVRPLRKGQKAEDKVTCGHCGLSWDDAKPTAYTPAPSARCPFEEFHLSDEEIRAALPHTLEATLADLLQLTSLGDVQQRLAEYFWQAGWTAAEVQRELSRLALLPEGVRLNLLNTYRDRSAEAAVHHTHPVEQALLAFRRQKDRAQKTRRGT